ncbi:hypothetical protein GCM10010470_50500 [Saccharopolyspora taberi]|uniref:Sugar ABC transporter permease n=1 Tax=Saccharopolyspora taberi TaxID=60895 RepID=A0ABN3VIP6_9PSEU
MDVQPPPAPAFRGGVMRGGRAGGDFLIVFLLPLVMMALAVLVVLVFTKVYPF